MPYPIEHQGEQALRDLLQIQIRDSLVRRRVDIISTVRCTLKSLGNREISRTRRLPIYTRDPGKTLATKASRPQTPDIAFVDMSSAGCTITTVRQRNELPFKAAITRFPADSLMHTCRV